MCKVIASGRNFKAFHDQLPDECYLEDFSMPLFDDETGEWALDDATEYELDGDVFYRSHHESIADEYEKWFVKQTTIQITITIPREREEDVKEHLRELGYLK